MHWQLHLEQRRSLPRRVKQYLQNKGGVEKKAVVVTAPVVANR